MFVYLLIYKFILHHFSILLGFMLAPVDILLLHFGIQNWPWGCPRRFRKRGCETSALVPQSAGQTEQKWDPEIATLVVFSMIGLVWNH